MEAIPEFLFAIVQDCKCCYCKEYREERMSYTMAEGIDRGMTASRTKTPYYSVRYVS